MKNKKTDFRFFTVAQWEEEEHYLRERHKEGWRLDHISLPGFYHFTACEPEDVVYRLDYNEEASKDKREYVQIFKDCGWEYVLKFVGYTYFRKTASQIDEADNEIFGDDESKLDMCKRVFRGRMVPLLLIFFAILVPQMVMSIIRVVNGETWIQGAVLLYGLLIALYLWIFVKFAYHYNHLRHRML